MMDRQRVPQGGSTREGPASARPAPTIHPVLRHFGAAGNYAIGRLVQTRLVVGAPRDAFELEADRVADHVVAGGAPSEAIAAADGGPVQRCACGGTCASCSAESEDDTTTTVQPLRISAAPAWLTQREATESCNVAEEPKEEFEQGTELDPDESLEAEPEKPVQRRAAEGEPSPTAELESRLDAARPNGRPLSGDTRRFMESRFQHDLSSVRIHTGPEADHLNHELNSYAFTTGRDIFFASGQFRPGERAGNHLLAHELTHVVQQAGGSGGLIQRNGPERKDYYRRLSGTLPGTVVHHQLEAALRSAFKDFLVTEAAIPGADRFSPELNKVGVADLYRSKPNRTVAGVKAYHKAAQDGDFLRMDAPSKVGTQPGVTSSPSFVGVKPSRSWIGDFPSDVWLGELKPFSTSKLIAGWNQLASYDKGYRDFVSQAAKVRKAGRGSITVSRLSLTLPAALDFDHFLTEHTRPNPDTTIGDYRIWVAAIGDGVYLYQVLRKNYKDPPRDWYLAQQAELQKLRDELAKNDSTVTKLQGKFRPGGTPARLVQRAGADRGPKYWTERGQAWEKKRATWAARFRGDVRAKYGDWREKLRFEKAIKRSSPVVQTEVKQFKSLMFWSGFAGKFLGKVRYLLGAAWDKIHGVFERMKEKMHDVRQRVRGVSESGFLAVGWRKTLIKVLVAASKIAFSKFLTLSFNFFVDCFKSAIDKVAAKFREDIPSSLAAQLCKVRKYYETAKERLETEWGTTITTLQEIVGVISDAKRWVDIATGLITLIRAGVQAISCLTPPALGCLWGAVAQIGIGAALDLIIGTEWFNTRIVNPTIGKLVRSYATPQYQRLINWALGENLKEYHCQIPTEGGEGGDVGVTGGLSGTALLVHRNKWEQKYAPEIMEQLSAVLTGKGGKPATEREIRALLRALKTVKPELLQRLLARASAKGKVSVEFIEMMAGIESTLSEVAAPRDQPEPPSSAPQAPEPAAGQKGAGADATAPSPTASGGAGPVTGPGAGGGAGTEGTETVYQATRPPANLKPRPIRPLTWIIIQGMTPKEKYQPGQKVKVMLEMFSNEAPDNSIIVDGVEVVFLKRRFEKDNLGRFRAVFDVHFAEEWYVPEEDLKVQGGPDHPTTYRFGYEDSR
jgi:hypothetical protein